MKMIKAIAAAAAITAFAGTAQAQDSGAYAGVGVDAFEFDFYGVSGKLGYNFSEYFGVEGQLGFGVIDDDETLFGQDVSTGVDLYGAAFLTGRAPVGEQFDIIGRVGYYVADLSAEAGGQSASESTDDFAFGIGGQYNFGTGFQNGVRLEYTNLQGDGGSGDLFSLGYIRKF